MFTGLVEAVGTVERVAGRSGNRLLTVKAAFSSELAVGESVAVNGTCLTVTNVEVRSQNDEERSFTVEAVAATLKATTMGELHAGSKVNLERALRVGDRMGGHMVQGHVDEVGRVRRVEHHPGSWTVAVSVDRKNRRLFVEKGSVCLDGVSLTIAEARPAEFAVNIIPHTWENTTLRFLRAGSRVNTEYDIAVKALLQRDS